MLYSKWHTNVIAPNLTPKTTFLKNYKRFIEKFQIHIQSYTIIGHFSLITVLFNSDENMKSSMLSVFFENHFTVTLICFFFNTSIIKYNIVYLSTSTQWTILIHSFVYRLNKITEYRKTYVFLLICSGPCDTVIIDVMTRS